VIVSGNGRLTAPGQTTQLSAQATMSDGSKRDITATATWQSGDTSIATVSETGLVAAVGFGFTGIGVRIPAGYSQGLTIVVLPAGAYILSGQLSVLGATSAADVRVEIIGGPMSGHATMTDLGGHYRFIGVSGVQQVKASKAGYLSATQNVSQDTGRDSVAVNFFELVPDVPYASVGRNLSAHLQGVGVVPTT
jgi:hypothetical protein